MMDSEIDRLSICLVCANDIVRKSGDIVDGCAVVTYEPCGCEAVYRPARADGPHLYPGMLVGVTLRKRPQLDTTK